jgi:protease-4
MRRLRRLLPWNRAKKRRTYVKLKLPAGVQLASEGRQLGPFTLASREPGAWWAFEHLIETLRKDDQVEGVYFRVEGSKLGLAELSAVAERLGRLREAGKHIVCHLDQGMLNDYALAACADEILMTPPGTLYAFGLRIEMMSLGDAFSKIGLEASFVHLGRFKTAMHRFTRRRPSAAQSVMMRQLLHGLSDHVLGHLSERRKLPLPALHDALDRAPISARDAQRLGLVDRLVYPDAIQETLEKTTPDALPIKLLTTQHYLAELAPPTLRQARRRPAVAVLHLKGTIMPDGMGQATQLRAAITPKPVIRAIEALQKDPTVKALVLHIDSPGGSALASDLIWRALRRLGEHKPIIAAMGAVAGSGGYYIAVGAHQIVAHPATITGSIGVIAGKISGGGLAHKLGVHLASLQQHAAAGFTSLTDPLSEQEAHNLRRDIRAFYRRFLHRVSVGRNTPRRKLHRLAQGRVYTGLQAQRLGLVDQLGDLDDAISLACAKAGLEREHAQVRFVDHRSGPLRRWSQDHKDDLWAEAATPTTLPQQAAAWLSDLVPDDHQHILAAALLLREPAALALCPLLPSPHGASE